MFIQDFCFTLIFIGFAAECSFLIFSSSCCSLNKVINQIKQFKTGREYVRKRGKEEEENKKEQEKGDFPTPSISGVLQYSRFTFMLSISCATTNIC